MAAGHPRQPLRHPSHEAGLWPTATPPSMTALGSRSRALAENGVAPEPLAAVSASKAEQPPLDTVTTAIGDWWQDARCSAWPGGAASSACEPPPPSQPLHATRPIRVEDPLDLAGLGAKAIRGASRCDLAACEDGPSDSGATFTSLSGSPLPGEDLRRHVMPADADSGADREDIVSMWSEGDDCQMRQRPLVSRAVAMPPAPPLAPCLGGGGGSAPSGCAPARSRCRPQADDTALCFDGAPWPTDESTQAWTTSWWPSVAATAGSAGSAPQRAAGADTSAFGAYSSAPALAATLNNQPALVVGDATCQRRVGFATADSPVLEFSSIDEVDQSDFDHYSQALARQLSQGHDDIRNRVLSFMKTQEFGLRDHHTGKSDFEPFEFNVGPGGEELVRIIVDVTIRKRVTTYEIAYRSRTTTRTGQSSGPHGSVAGEAGNKAVAPNGSAPRDQRNFAVDTPMRAAAAGSSASTRPAPFKPEWWERRPEDVESEAASQDIFDPACQPARGGKHECGSINDAAKMLTVLPMSERRQPHDDGPSLALPTLRAANIGQGPVHQDQPPRYACPEPSAAVSVGMASVSPEKHGARIQHDTVQWLAHEEIAGQQPVARQVATRSGRQQSPSWPATGKGEFEDLTIKSAACSSKAFADCLSARRTDSSESRSGRRAPRFGTAELHTEDTTYATRCSSPAAYQCPLSAPAVSLPRERTGRSRWPSSTGGTSDANCASSIETIPRISRPRADQSEAVEHRSASSTSPAMHVPYREGKSSTAQRDGVPGVDEVALAAEAVALRRENALLRQRLLEARRAQQTSAYKRASSVGAWACDHHGDDFREHDGELRARVSDSPSIVAAAPSSRTRSTSPIANVPDRCWYCGCEKPSCAHSGPGNGEACFGGGGNHCARRAVTRASSRPSSGRTLPGGWGLAPELCHQSGRRVSSRSGHRRSGSRGSLMRMACGNEHR